MQRGSGVLAEVPLTPTQDDPHQVHTHLLNQPGLERLSANVARAEGDVLLCSEGLRLRHGTLYAVGDEGEWCLWEVPVNWRLVSHHEHGLPDRRAAVPSVRPNEKTAAHHPGSEVRPPPPGGVCARGGGAGNQILVP